METTGSIPKRRATLDRRQRLADVPVPMPGGEVVPARSTLNPLPLHHFAPGALLAAGDLNRFVDALLALDERLAAVEAKLGMSVAT